MVMRAISVLLLALPFSALLTVSAQAVSAGECRRQVRELTHGVVMGMETRAREQLATDLATFMAQNPGCGRSARTVDDISALLADRDDAIRFSAAEALASIGPPARRAIGPLKKALQESDAAVDADLDATGDLFIPTAYSGQAIREALKAITGKAVPDYVRHGAQRPGPSEQGAKP